MLAVDTCKKLLQSWYSNFDKMETHTNVNIAVLTLITMGINLVGYTFLDWTLRKMADGDMYTKLSFSRQRYVLKNISKGVYLTFLSMYAIPKVISYIIYDQWSNYEIHNLGLAYMIPDLVALIRVPKLKRPTIHHHLTVMVLTTLNLFCDYSVNTYWRGMVIYATMSMITGSVNFYLGLRLVINDPNVKKHFASMAFFNYAVSIVINWTYQLYVVSVWITYVVPLWGLYFYLILIYFVVVDDVILLKFLWNAMTKKRGLPTTNEFVTTEKKK